ncbi:MAG: peptidyl-prolyl cis-trans isomerase [bacterium]
MKKKAVLIILGLIFMAALCAAKQLDAILVKVNDEVILKSEVDESVEMLMAQAKLSGKTQDKKDLEKKILQNIIEQKLITTMAKEESVEISDDAVTDKVNDFIDSMRARYPSEEVFEEALQKEGISYGDFRLKIETQVKDSLVYSKIKQKKQQEFIGKAAVSDEEIKNYFEKNKDDFRTQDEVSVSQIYAGKEGADAEKMKVQIEAAYARLKTEGFASVMNSVNGKNGMIGADIGWIDVSKMDKKIKEGIRKLKKGGFTPVIETDAGFIIIKLNASKIGNVLEFSAVREKARIKLIEERIEIMWAEWIEKIKAAAYIKYFDVEEK